MSKAGGFILVLNNGRQQVFDDTEEDYFAEPVKEFSHSRNLPLICFVVSNIGKIIYVSKGRKGQLAGTDLRRLNLTDFIEVTESVSINDVLERAENRVKKKLNDKFILGGLLPPKSFQEVISILSEIAPSIRETLKLYSEERLKRISNISEKASNALAQQKEAIATALTLARLERKELEGWDIEDSKEPASFLDGLPQVRLREDPMVINDLENLPGFEEIKSTTSFGSVVFENDQSRLTVLLANRLPLEKQLGTDLIYYNETYSCFLMVQYKAMEDEGENSVYRFPNPQLTEEIARMDEVLSELAKCSENQEADGFRLSENPFFLKICPRITFNPDNIGLIKGMYLPLDYWRLISKHPSMAGSKGGKRISYSNARRYLDNSSFITIASNAWVGTNIEQSKELASLIRKILETGRAVVFAIAKDKELRHQSDS